MPVASSLTTALFVTLVMLMVGGVASTLRRAFPERGALAVAIFGAIWLVIPALLAASGRLDRYDTVPPPALALVLVITLTTIGIAFSVKGAYLFHAVPLWLLVGMQAFRIPMEWVLYRLHGEGVIPVQMTWSGRNFDVVSGITALLLGLWLRGNRPVPGWVVLAWNLLGIGLLLNIVAVAVMSTPTVLQVFTDGPANTLPSTFPWVWLPTFLVQLALIGHLLVFRKLGRAAAASDS